MSLPSKAQQIAAVAKFLDADHMEGRDLSEIAKEIVEGYHALLLGGLKVPASPARLGMLFTTPLDGKVRRYVWEGEGRCWIVSETDSYGWLGPFPGPFLEYCEEHRPATFKEVDGKRKRMPLTDEEIEKKWSNPNWRVGQLLSQSQRQHSFEIIATAPKSALLRGTDGRLVVDDNDNLARYYKRENKAMEAEW